MEAELRALLVNAGSVTAHAPATSILWDRRNGIPAIALWLIDEPAEAPTMKGPTNLAGARVQVDCWASDGDAAHDMGEAVIAVLNGYRGGVIKGVFLLARARTSQPDTAAPATGAPSTFHRARLDFRVWHQS